MRSVLIHTEGGRGDLYGLELSINGFRLQRVDPPLNQGSHPYWTSEIFEGNTLSLRRGEPLRLLEDQKEVFLGSRVTDVTPISW